MTQRERRGWIIVASLWVTLFVAFGGGYNTVPVFIPALVTHFGLGRAPVSLLPRCVPLSNGSIPPTARRRNTHWRTGRRISGGIRNRGSYSNALILADPFRTIRVLLLRYRLRVSSHRLHGRSWLQGANRSMGAERVLRVYLAQQNSAGIIGRPDQRTRWSGRKFCICRDRHFSPLLSD